MTQHRLMLLCAALLLALPAAPLRARQYHETAPANPEAGYVVTAKRFGSGDPLGGTYYAPQVVTTSDTVWLFAMGGQFADGGPAEKCRGDKVLVFKLPLTEAGLKAGVTSSSVRQRVSPCDNASGDTSRLYHYSAGDVVFDNTHKTYRMISERWEARSNTIKVRLFEGWYRSTGVGWNVTWYDFMDVAEGQGPERVTAFLLHPDTFRAGRVAGNSYYRGYMKMGQWGMAEVRVEFPPLGTCPTPGPGLPPTRRCANIEFKRGGAWTALQNQTLNFIPDQMPEDFRISKLTTVNGGLQLWGAELGENSTAGGCGRCPGVTEQQQSSTYIYRTVTPGADWILGPRNYVTSSVRCMPAWHRTLRMGLAFVRLPSGKLFMLSSSNDADICNTLGNPFHGVDIVWTQLQ